MQPLEVSRGPGRSIIRKITLGESRVLGLTLSMTDVGAYVARLAYREPATRQVFVSDAWIPLDGDAAALHDWIVQEVNHVLPWVLV